MPYAGRVRQQQQQGSHHPHLGAISGMPPTMVELLMVLSCRLALTTQCMRLLYTVHSLAHSSALYLEALLRRGSCWWAWPLNDIHADA